MNLGLWKKNLKKFVFDMKQKGDGMWQSGRLDMSAILAIYFKVDDWKLYRLHATQFTC